ncbi:hypothetical protein Ahia01_001246300 [Argonauta hians]
MMHSDPITISEEQLYDSLNSNKKQSQKTTDDSLLSPAFYEDGGGGEEEEGEEEEDNQDDDDDDSMLNSSNMMTLCTPSAGSFDSSYATDDSPSNISSSIQFNFDITQDHHPPQHHLHHHYHQQQQQRHYQQLQQPGDEQEQQQPQSLSLSQFRTLSRRNIEGPLNYPPRRYRSPQQQQQQLQHPNPHNFSQHLLHHHQQQQQQQQQQQHDHHHVEQQFQALTLGTNLTTAVGAEGGGGGGGSLSGVSNTSLCSVDSMGDYPMHHERRSNDFDENDENDDDDVDDAHGDDDDDDGGIRDDDRGKNIVCNVRRLRKIKERGIGDCCSGGVDSDVNDMGGVNVDPGGVGVHDDDDDDVDGVGLVGATYGDVDDDCDDDDDDDDVFSEDGAIGNSAFPGSQPHGVSHSQPIPIRAVARRNISNDLGTMNYYQQQHHQYQYQLHHQLYHDQQQQRNNDNNIINNQNTINCNNNNSINNNHLNNTSNNNGSTSSSFGGSPSSFPMTVDHHFMPNLRNNFSNSFQGLSPDCCPAGNILVSCSWSSDLRRTIGTQTHPTLRRTRALLGIQTACLHNQTGFRAYISSTGSVSRRLCSEGEDPGNSPRQDPLPDLVPVPRDRAHSLPVPLRRNENFRAIGQELRRISDEYFQNRNNHSHHQQHGQQSGLAFSFPGANRIHDLLRILFQQESSSSEEEEGSHPRAEPPPSTPP